MGDSGYDCNYCHDKNRLAKECMLRRMNEKKDEEDEEAYYLIKLEEIKKKKNVDHSNPAFIMQEDDDEFGRVEVWSTDSEDEEVRRPAHGECFIMKVELLKYEGKCMMVHSDISDQRGYASDGDKTSDNCFAAKHVSEQINECERLIRKVHSILKSLNIHVS